MIIILMDFIPHHIAIVMFHVGGVPMFKWSVHRKDFNNPVRSEMRPLAETQQNPSHSHAR